MNKETKLILESLDWIMYNTTPVNEIQARERAELLGRINDCLYPEEEQTQAEKTEEHFGEDNDALNVKEEI